MLSRKLLVLTLILGALLSSFVFFSPALAQNIIIRPNNGLGYFPPEALNQEMPLGDNDIAIYVLFHDLSVDKLIASWNDPLRDPTADEQQTFDYLYKTFNVPPIRVKYALEKINAVMLAIKSRRSIIVKKGSEWMIASDDELSLIEKNLEKLDKSFSRFLEYGVKWITRPKAPKSSPPNKIPKNGIL